jgi:hypothetical protein
MTGARTLTFTDHDTATAFLRQRGFSVGPVCADDARGVLWGYPRMVGPWRSLSQQQRDTMDGQLSTDPATRAIVLTIFAHAPAAARAAVSKAA